ncbi:MAG: hypothetical protein J6L87_04355 [Clostridia bacterium]|nr:hypothetical protein [Clostridia bacterium]
MKKLHNRAPLLFRIALALLCLLLVTSHYTGGLYARYVAVASGKDSARVAKFAVSSNLNGATPLVLSGLEDLTPGASQNYDLRVKNDSEVSVFYRFEASCLGNLPLKFEITSSGAGTLAPGAAEAVHTLTVTWPSSAKDVSLAGEIDIVTVTLTCTQVD